MALMVDRRIHSISPNGNQSNPLRLRKYDSLHRWPFPFRDQCLQTTFDCARGAHDGAFYKRLLTIIASGFRSSSEEDVVLLLIVTLKELVLVTPSRDV